MELVIKIPEDEYRWIIKSDKTVFADIASKECMLHAIKNGIPLPKGHGRLGDLDKILKNAEEIYNASNMKDIINPAQMYAIREILTNARTIIETDKEGD